MRKWSFLVSLGILATGAALVLGQGQGPDQEGPPYLKKELSGYGDQSYRQDFSPGKPATATLVLGLPTETKAVQQTHGVMGLYVLDQHGNCVAREDLIDYKSRDGVGAVWYPQEKGTYTLEVVNFSPYSGAYELGVN